VRRSDAESDLGIGQKRLFDFVLGPGREPHANRRIRAMEPADHADQDVSNEVLAGHHMHFLRPLVPAEEPGEPHRPLEERLAVRKELLSLGCEWSAAARTSAL